MLMEASWAEQYVACHACSWNADVPINIHLCTADLPDTSIASAARTWKAKRDEAAASLIVAQPTPTARAWPTGEDTVATDHEHDQATLAHAVTAPTSRQDNLLGLAKSAPGPTVITKPTKPSEDL
jgi:hypothetical protein